MNEEDLRVQRTRRLLKEALVDLVVERGYEPVTIRDITKEAQVGYKTFFRHYESKEALLRTILDDFLEEFKATRLPPTAPNAPQQNTLAVVKFTEAHADLFRMLIRSPASDLLQAPFVEFGRKDLLQFAGGSGIPDELMAYYFAASMDALLRWWVVNDMPYPAEEMAGYINQLLMRVFGGDWHKEVASL
ncbi:MAG: TetR/AcrR family transcriptional regulator [Chloroflexota bacterium]